MFGQVRGVVVATSSGDQGVDEPGPVGESRGVAAAQTGVEFVLPEVLRLGGLGWAGRSVVAVGDGVRGPPDCEITEQVRGGQRSSWRPPGRNVRRVGGLLAYLAGDRGDQFASGVEVRAPVRVALEGMWDAGEPGERSGAGAARVGQAPVEHGGAVVGGVQLAGGGRGVQGRQRVGSGGGEQDEVGAQGRPGWVVGDARDDPVGAGVEVGEGGGAEVVFGGDVDGVEVAGGGGAEPQGGGGVGTGGGGGRDGCVVAGEDGSRGCRSRFGG